MGKYRSLGTLFNRVFRNDLNANFDDVDADIQAQKTRVDNLVVSAGNSNAEIVDARGGKAVLRDRLDGVDSFLANIATQPSKNSGETDYTLALQRSLDSLQQGGVLYIPQGKTIDFTEVTITKPDITITGGGVLKGTITIDYLGDINLKLDNLVFDCNLPIQVKKGRTINIVNNVFKNADKAIYINPPSGSGAHTSSMLNISANKFYNVNYCLYVDHPDKTSINHQSIGTMITNDCHFVNNFANIANISHIYAETIDGLVVSGNTFFHSASTAKSTTKKHCIEIKTWADWVLIQGNNLFEAGYEAIKLGNVLNFNITGNHIAVAGERYPSSAIKIYYNRASGDTTTNLTSYSTITGNVLYKATLHGIELVNVQNVDCFNNNILLYKTNSDPYYGYVSGQSDTDLTAISHQYVYTSSDNNMWTNNNRTNSISTTATTIDASVSDLVLLQQPSATSIDTIINGTYGRRLTIMAVSNANTTIKYVSGKIVLKDNKDFPMKQNDCITLVYNFGVWYEVTRLQKSNATYKDLNTNVTTIDVSDGVCEVYCNQSTANTVTQITQAYNGQEITLVGFSGNTTIQNSSTIILKGAINANIPANGIMRLGYYYNRWIEISRNF